MQPEAPAKLALRIDDIGASSKEFLYYTKRWYSNWGPLRDQRLFGKWAPYRELDGDDWRSVFKILKRFRSKLTVGITACWVENDGELVPFPSKFPEEAEVLAEGVQLGLIEIANHGLTHCVLDAGKYRRRRLYGTNRSYHREFWDWVPADVQRDHLTRAQKILTDYFKVPITTFVPPGNVYAESTVKICQELGIQRLNCERPQIKLGDSPKILGDDHVVPFHDRELVLFGVGWLERKLRSFAVPPDRFVREL